MIRKPQNWESVQLPSDRKKIPAGAYVVRIKKAAVQNNGYGDQLCLLFDITEGDYAGYYGSEFSANTMTDKKWKGVLRVFLPVDDGSEKDEWTKRTFKGMVTAFEKSNPGYVFNWDEATLVGKTVGVLFRNEEWDYNGKTGWTAKPFRAISADSVREGAYTLPKDKPLADKSASGFGTAGFGGFPGTANSFAEVDNDDELPF